MVRLKRKFPILLAGLLAALVLAAPIVSAASETTGSRGLRPAQLGVVINIRDPASVRLGRIYAQRRGIPDINVIELDFAPGEPELHPGEFAVLKRRLDAELPAAVEALALVWTVPYRVGCMSVTSAFAFGFDRAYCASGCRHTRSNPYAGSASAKPYTDFGIRPAMLLAASSEAEGLRLVERGIAADATRPTGTVYLVETEDKARSRRAPLFIRTAARFRDLVDVKIMRADGLRNRDDVLVYQTGAVHVPDLFTNGFVPGALADHLTSTGGRLTGGSQMSALRWLEAGATASYGTVVEPCNFIEKFPHPEWLLAAYLAGDSAIEAYWKSVLMPGQGVFIGEPLARPYAPAVPAIETRGLAQP